MNILELIKSGGVMVYPILILGLIVTIIAVDKFLTYKRWASLDNPNHPSNYYYQLAARINENIHTPIWFIENQAKEEAGLIEKELSSGLWVLETSVTAAPLLGLLGTIIGIMNSFKLMSGTTANLDGITAGVSEALIATACGLVVAVAALFVFNYFSEKQSKFLDDLERYGNNLIDQIKLKRNF